MAELEGDRKAMHCCVTRWYSISDRREEAVEAMCEVEERCTLMLQVCEPVVRLSHFRTFATCRSLFVWRVCCPSHNPSPAFSPASIKLNITFIARFHHLPPTFPALLARRRCGGSWRRATPRQTPCASRRMKPGRSWRKLQGSWRPRWRA